MQWSDQGIVLGVRKHGESSAILETLTRAHGRHLGLIRGGRSRRHAATLQPGNTLGLVWNARIEEQLGNFAIEPEELRAARLIDSAAALYGLGYIASLLRVLPEREPHEDLYEAATVVLDHLDRPAIAAPLVVRLEIGVLRALGFGLDLTACAATGATQELVYVSPKSARAVSAGAGAAYHDRLLPLPAFVQLNATVVSASALADGFRLTGYFLERDVFSARGLTMPEQRDAFLREAIATG
ncbi:MAG: DNA repair protein RecO [Beijerinckiaceae bacterium]